MNRYMPLAINMAGQRCLVVGGGRVAARKVATLVDAGAEVILVAPKIAAPLGKLAESGRLQWRRGPYDPAIEGRFTLIVAASDDRALNGRICRAADARGILSCNVSEGNRSRVIFPAVCADRQVTVAVHSQGRDCRLSQKVRDNIAEWLAARESEKPGTPADR